MASSNPLISVEGFKYLAEQITNPGNSNETLLRLVESLYIPHDISRLTRPKITDLKELRKELQYQGILQLLTTLSLRETKRIAEFCCGNGELSRFLADQVQLKITGIDLNSGLIKKSKAKNQSTNLDFRCQDIYTNADTELEADLFLGLHCCGALLDRIIDLAISSEVPNLIVVPCCYGKINKSQGVLPKSPRLKSQEERFYYLLRKTIRFEGLAGNHPESRNDITLEALRRLIDMDRIFYLQERGYEASFVKICPRSIRISERQYPLSPLNVAIFARK